MPIGHDGGKHARRRAQARAAARRRGRRARLIALALIVLPTVLVAAAPVQASMTPAERQALRAARLAEHQASREANQAAQQAKKQAAQQVRTERWEAKHPNANVTIGCNQMTVSYRGFPEGPGNTVEQTVTIDHDHSTRQLSKFEFEGPTATAVIPLDGHAGRYQVDLWARFAIDGAKLHFDKYNKVNCPPAPALTIEKLQRIAPETAYTPLPLNGEAGQTVEYEMVVKNTGNTPLTLGALNDPRCDPGTIAGGPPSGTLAMGESSTFTCTHVLTAADKAAGSYANTAGDTATPVGEGSPVTGESNTVVVNLPAGEVQPEKTEEPAGKTTTTTTTTTNGTPSSGVLALTAAPTGSTGVNGSSPKVGVLASKTVAVPSLSVPHGCVRSSFRASIKSAGVRSVSFYMDGHKLKTLTARNARKGRLTIAIDPTQLSVGSHRLLAKITMNPASSSAKARHATRTSTVLRCSSAVLTPRFTG